MKGEGNRKGHMSRVGGSRVNDKSEDQEREARNRKENISPRRARRTTEKDKGTLVDAFETQKDSFCHQNSCAR